MKLFAYVAILVAGLAAQQMVVGLVRREPLRAGTGAGLLVVAALYFYVEIQRGEF